MTNFLRRFWFLILILGFIFIFAFSSLYIKYFYLPNKQVSTNSNDPPQMIQENLFLSPYNYQNAPQLSAVGKTPLNALECVPENTDLVGRVDLIGVVDHEDKQYYYLFAYGRKSDIADDLIISVNKSQCAIEYFNAAGEITPFASVLEAPLASKLVLARLQRWEAIYGREQIERELSAVQALQVSLYPEEIRALKMMGFDVR